MDIPWNCVRDGVTPPPPTLGENSLTMENVGHVLLALVRSLEKPSNSNHSQLVQEIALILQNLLAVYSRRGLLQGDVTKAEKIMQNSGQGATVVGGGRRQKRSRKKGNREPDGELQIYDQEGDIGVESKSLVQDETLVLSSLVRILGGSGGTEVESSPILRHDISLITIAAQIVLSLSERIKSLISRDLCSLAENEVIASSGRALLAGLSRTMRALLASIRDNTMDGEQKKHFFGFKIDSPDSREKLQTLSSCLRATASLFTLFGTKLSRSSSIRSEISTVGWSALTVPNKDVQLSAAALLASVPLTCGGQKSTPANEWSSSVVESVAALFMLVDAIALPARKSRNGNHKFHLTKKGSSLLIGWVDLIRQSPNDAGQRGTAFLTVTRGLVKYFLALLRREGYDSRALSVLTSTKVPIDYMLDLSEAMISFPTAAESMYYGTKKRLRMEPVEGGLLSPAQVVLDIANSVKALGHDVFDTVVSSLGRSALIPHGRRITGIVYASLLTCCSWPLRKVLDPSNSTRLDGKRRRWLHSSIPLRTRAISSFKVSILACGSNAVVSPATTRAERETNRRDNSIKSIAIVAGCLLEQFNWKRSAEASVCEDWGMLGERVELATLSAEALTSCLASCGGYMQLKSRSLIDSVVSSCLSSMIGKGSQLCSLPPVRTALLTVGVNCISTPWPDGTSSSVTEMLRAASSICTFDRDANVSATAHSALSVCDALAMPRAPPLSVNIRRENESGTATPLQGESSAKNLVEGMRSARQELIEAMKRDSNAVSEVESTRESKRSKVEESEQKETAASKGEKMASISGNAQETVTPKHVMTSSPIPTIDSTLVSTSKNFADSGEVEEEMRFSFDIHPEVSAEGDGFKETALTTHGLSVGADTGEATDNPPMSDPESRSEVTEGTPIAPRLNPEKAEEHGSWTTEPRPDSNGAGRVNAILGKGATIVETKSESESESELPEIFDCGPDDDDV